MTFRFFKIRLKIAQRFSMGFKSGLCAGQSKTVTPLLSKYSLHNLLVCLKSLSNFHLKLDFWVCIFPHMQASQFIPHTTTKISVILAQQFSILSKLFELGCYVFFEFLPCRPNEGLMTISSMTKWLPTAAHALQIFTRSKAG